MAESFSSTYGAAYTTFSGADIKAVVHGHTFGNMLSCSWNITREKAPIYVMGVKDPVSVSRGKRGIAGTLTFQNFQMDAMKMLIDEDPTYFTYTDYLSNVSYLTQGWEQTPDAPNSGWTNWLTASTQVSKNTKAFYADQMVPFDITLTYVNEYGNMAVEQVYGVEILNEGKGVHIDDMAVETAMTFICRGIGKLTPYDVSSISSSTYGNYVTKI